MRESIFLHHNNTIKEEGQTLILCIILDLSPRTGSSSKKTTTKNRSAPPFDNQLNIKTEAKPPPQIKNDRKYPFHKHTKKKHGPPTRKWEKPHRLPPNYYVQITQPTGDRFSTKYTTTRQRNRLLTRQGHSPPFFQSANSSSAPF